MLSVDPTAPVPMDEDVVAQTVEGAVDVAEGVICSLRVKAIDI